MDHQDAFWIERARRGDHAAFGLLVEKYTARLVRIVMRTTGQPDDSYDLIQETWIQAYLGLHRLRDPSVFEGWIVAIARNVARRWLRRQRAMPASWDLIDDLAHHATSPLDDLMLACFARDAVLDAIERLSPINREVVQLHYLEGWSYQQIAAQLGVPAKTIKSRLHKARRQLKPQLQPIDDMLFKPMEETMIEATIYEVYADESTTGDERLTIVVLKAREQERYLPIWIGQPEGEGIAAHLRSIKSCRPLTYDLMAQLLQHLGGRVAAVEINALRDETFFATLRIANGSRFELDCRPSDALALAIRTNAPIFIAAEVLATAGRDQPEAAFKRGDEEHKRSVTPLELKHFRQSSYYHQE